LIGFSRQLVFSSNPERLNILIIPCTEWLKGSQQRLHHLSKEWHKRNNIIVFYLERNDDVSYESNSLERLRYSSMVRIPTFRFRNYSLFLFVNFVIQAIFLLKIIKSYKIDVIVAEGIGPSNAGLFASKVTKRRFIFDYSDSYSSFVASYVSNSFLKNLLELVAILMTNINTRFSCATVIVNDKLLLDANVRHQKIVNGVTEEYFPIAANSDKNPDGTFVISFMGAVESWVDFNPVMDAIAIFNRKAKRNLILKIIGDGSKLSYAKKLAKEKGIASSVVFTGWVPYSKLYEYLADSDICILPFDCGKISFLSMPMKIHEYAISKKAIISTPLPEIKRIYGSSIIYATSTQEYLTSIEQLLDDKDLKSRLVNRAYTIAKGYSWGRLAVNYERLLRAKT
jgi:glycosyltransferase involved in cell wall biosynthesis